MVSSRAQRISKKSPEEFYDEATARLNAAGYEAEVSWQYSVLGSEISESAFLREYAWVVLNSGFRERIVRRKFDYISLCFCDWESGSEIVKAGPICVDAARAAINHVQKMWAIYSTAELLSTTEFNVFRTKLHSDPIGTLKELPRIGDVTVYHLAKNLGLAYAKPDRHLVAASRHFGFSDVQDFCRHIAEARGVPIPVVDLVVWRYMESAI